jgi:hypothetical protein
LYPQSSEHGERVWGLNRRVKSNLLPQEDATYYSVRSKHLFQYVNKSTFCI